MKEMFKTKMDLFRLISCVFVACLLISNILAAKTFMLFGITLPTAVIVFPIVYITNDILAEIFGFKRAKSTIYLGFIINLFAVIAYNVAILLPAPDFATEAAAAFKITLSSTWRILLASMVAYIIGSISNSYIMVRMKEKLESKLMLRCVVSTLVGEGLDALFFITIAFIGTMPIVDLLIMIIAQAIFKTLFEIVVYPVTKMVIKHLNKIPD